MRVIESAGYDFPDSVCGKISLREFPGEKFGPAASGASSLRPIDQTK